MNKSIFITLAVIGILIMASCSRCKQCSYKYKVKGVDTTVTLTQECGNAAEFKAYESKAKAEAAVNNATNEDVVCEKVK